MIWSVDQIETASPFAATDYHSLAMGLDAVVYRNKANLPFDADAVGAVVDESTGEYYMPNLDLEPAFDQRFPWDTRVAVDKRIGNIAQVALLRQKTSQVLPERSIVLSKVLYSGVHSGDSIPIEQTFSLRDELLQLGRYAKHLDCDDLKQFVTDMLQLVEATRREGNPIVFV